MLVREFERPWRLRVTNYHIQILYVVLDGGRDTFYSTRTVEGAENR